MAEFEIPLRITLVDPPAGVLFALQRRRDELVDPQRSTGAEISFELKVRVKGEPGSTDIRFLGEFVQGPSGAKFIYINSGMAAGDRNTCWQRRAKIHLAGITWPDLLAAQGDPERLLEARIPGTGRDGGPVCATVRLLGEGWRLGPR